MAECSNIVLFPGDRVQPLSSIQDAARIISDLCRNLARLKEEALDASGSEHQALEALIDIQLNTIAIYAAYLRNADDPLGGQCSGVDASASPG
jgi:ATP/maltotriose-dependent transcriptional regulator MalT